MITPPVAASAASTASMLFFIVAALYFGVSLVWSIVSVRRVGILPLALLAGGLLAALQEGPIDRMILLWYPRNAPAIAWTSMGVPQPLYMILIYGGFVGGGSYVVYRSLVSGRGARGLWSIFFGIVVMDALFEIPATAGHVFSYYGDQPFQFVQHGWALYLGFIAAAAPVLAGWLLYYLAPLTRGAGVWALALIPPTAWAAAYLGVGWPVYLAMGSQWPSALIWGGGMITMVLSCAMVAALGKVALVRSASPRGGEPTWLDEAQPAAAARSRAANA